MVTGGITGGVKGKVTWGSLAIKIPKMSKNVIAETSSRVAESILKADLLELILAPEVWTRGRIGLIG